MQLLRLLLLSLCISQGQTVEPRETPPLENPLTAPEKRTLASKDKISSRSQVYLEAAGRRLQTAQRQVAGGNSEAMQASLVEYNQILELCLEELRNLPDERRQDLKKHEIKLRGYVASLDEMETRLGYFERLPVRESISTSRKLRQAFLSAFFGSKSLRKP